MRADQPESKPPFEVGYWVDGRFRIEEGHREGGFAYVYKAYDERLKRAVAIKVPKNHHNNQAWDALIREAVSHAQINHKNVLPIITADREKESGIPYIVLRWVDGSKTLLDFYPEHQHDGIFEELLDVAIQIAEGLEAIHDHGILHGDISPKNILIQQENEYITPLWSDFGLSHGEVDDLLAERGTLPYLAPEQINHERHDQRSEIYALGVIFFELFGEGTYYLHGTDRTDSHIRDEIPRHNTRSLFELKLAYSEKLDKLLAKMFNLAPEKRPKSLSEVVLELKKIRTEQASGVQVADDLDEYDDFDEYIHLDLKFSEHIRPGILNKVREMCDQNTFYVCYLYNRGIDATKTLNFWISLAVDSDNPANKSLISWARENESGYETLTLECKTSRDNKSVYVNKIQYKGLFGFRAVNSVPIRIIFGQGTNNGLPDHIRRLIVSQSADPTTLETKRRLEHWEKYLTQWETNLEKQRTKFVYSEVKEDPQSKKVIWFLVENDEIDEEILQENRGERVEVIEGDPDATLASKPKSVIEIGTFIEFVEEPHWLIVELSDRFISASPDHLSIPQKGYLQLSRRGDRAQIAQQRYAIERLKNGATANPRLPKFIFDAAQARLPDPEEKPIILGPDDLLSDPKKINAQQLEAITGALNAPDLYLIQGPPGTGKTTVIAELCYQFARRGKRVLVASQTHLAVDNVLSRLLHHPKIIPFRFGDSQKVEHEGQSFTEQKVVDQWFGKTAADCQTELSLRAEQNENFQLFDTEFLAFYIQKLDAANLQLPTLRENEARFVSSMQDTENGISALSSSLAALEILLQLFQNTKSFLKTPRIFEYQESNWKLDEYDFILDECYQHFLENFVASLKVAKKLGLASINATLPLGLQLDSLYIENLATDNRTAKTWRHNVLAMLTAGKQLYLRLLPQREAINNVLENATQAQRLIEEYLRLEAKQKELTSARQEAGLLLQISRDIFTADEMVANYKKLLELKHELADNESKVNSMTNDIRILSERIAKINDAIGVRSDVELQVSTIEQKLDILGNRQSTAWQNLYGYSRTIQQYEGITSRLKNRSDIQSALQKDIETYGPVLGSPGKMYVLLLDWYKSYVRQPWFGRLEYDLSKLKLPERLKNEVKDFFDKAQRKIALDIPKLTRIGSDELKRWEHQRTRLDSEISQLQSQVKELTSLYQLAKENYQKEEDSLRLETVALHDAIQQVHKLTGINAYESLGNTLEALNWNNSSPMALSDTFVKAISAANSDQEKVFTYFENQTRELEITSGRLIELQHFLENLHESHSKDQEKIDSINSELQDRLTAAEPDNPIFANLTNAITAKLQFNEVLVSWQTTRKQLCDLIEIKRPSIFSAMAEIQENEIEDLDLVSKIEGLLVQIIDTRNSYRQDISELINKLELQYDLDSERERLQTEVRDLIYCFSHSFLATNAIRSEIAIELGESNVKEKIRLTGDELQRQESLHTTTSDQLKICKEAIKVIEDELAPFRNHWQKMHNSIPEYLRSGFTGDIHTVTYIKEILVLATDSGWKEEQLRRKQLFEPSQKLAKEWIARLEEKRPDDMEHIKEIYIRNANVIGVTCGQVNRLDKFQHSALPFDVVIVDEVSKATPPELFMPLIKGRKVVLVGDHKQLPPLVKNNSLEDVAREIGVSVADLDHLRRSIFGGLYESAPDRLRCMLVEQFRMRQPIMQAINQFYGDQLVGGHNRSHMLQMPGISSEQCIVWIDTPTGTPKYQEKFQGRSSYNDGEIEIIEKLLEQMNTAWMPNFQLNNKKKEIGVITFYLAQRRKIGERIGRKRLDALDIRIGTVDKFQGIERQVVIVSLVRNNTRGDIGFAEVPERINVAFSRAQELLVVVGSKSVFTRNFSKSGKAKEYYSRIADIIRREGGDTDATRFLKEAGKSTSPKNN